MERRYELVYVVSPDATDEQVADLHTQVEGIIQRMGGRLEKTESWGRRKLAYEIGRHKEGIYVLNVLVGSGELMKEIDRRLKVIAELVIRHLVVRVDEEQAVVERTREQRTASMRRRRVARGLPPDRQPGEGQREADDDRDDRFDMGNDRGDRGMDR